MIISLQSKTDLFTHTVKFIYNVYVHSFRAYLDMGTISTMLERRGLHQLLIYLLTSQSDIENAVNLLMADERSTILIL